MFKKRLLIFIFIAALLITLPVQAKGNETIGERISLWTGPFTFPAGDPFHVSHGFYLWVLEDVPVGIWSFELEVDGVLLKPDFNQTSVVWHQPTWLAVSQVFNFPNGMSAGSHTFTGNYYAPCSCAVELGWIPGPCPTPNAKVMFNTLTITVDFTD